MSAATVPHLLGSPIKRKEDPRLITGGASYVDDIRLLDMHYLAVVRSLHAHARIRSIDTAAARSCAPRSRRLAGDEDRGWR